MSKLIKNSFFINAKPMSQNDEEVLIARALFFAMSYGLLRTKKMKFGSRGLLLGTLLLMFFWMIFIQEIFPDAFLFFLATAIFFIYMLLFFVILCKIINAKNPETLMKDHIFLWIFRANK